MSDFILMTSEFSVDVSDAERAYVNRQPVDISDCIFYNDLLLKQLNEMYGFILKSSEVLYRFNKNNFMFFDDWNWELKFNYDLNWVDGLEEMETASFFGYKAYVMPGECIVLQYGEEMCIYIEMISSSEEKTTEALLSALEEQVFTE